MMKLILFSGIPGTGKSTLAEAVGRELQTPVFALDWLLGSLRPHGVLTNENMAAVSDSLMMTLVRRQFMLGQSAILDFPAHTKEIRVKWQSFAQEQSAKFRGIETICSDVDLHRQRTEGRVRSIPGWHEITWTHVEKMRERYEAWDEPHLIVDAVQPYEDNLRTVLTYIKEDL
jgi:predicted kinase